MKKQWSNNLVVGAAVLGLALSLRADPPAECGTVFRTGPPEISAPCELGPCDYVAERDAWIAEQTSARKLEINVLVHVLDREITQDLQEPARSARINDQLRDAEAAMDLRNIKLNMTSVIYDPGPYEAVSSESEICAMQVALAENPETQLNVYVTEVQQPLSFHARLDCNENETPDACDIASSESDDCNENGRPDDCEIADDPLADLGPPRKPAWTCQPDGVLDECQQQAMPLYACCFVDDCQHLSECACAALSGTWNEDYNCSQIVCMESGPQP